MNDFFGFSRTVKSQEQLASSEYATLQVGGRVHLIQSVNVNYAQQIRPVFEVGDPNLYWVTGHASGNIQVGRLVGTGGFFEGLTVGDCGVIDSLSIAAGGAACGKGGGGGGGLKFKGGILESVNVRMQAGTVEVSEGFNIRVAFMGKG